MWCVWIAASCRGSDISEHLLLLLLVVMMMEVSATSLLVILGIFCSSALAQPSPGLCRFHAVSKKQTLDF